MKQKLLLFLFIGSLTASADAQRNKEQRTTAFAITASQKGSSAWTEVRLIDVKSGEVVKTVYTNKDEVPTLNARTKKPTVKKEAGTSDLLTTKMSGNAKVMEMVKSRDNVVTYTFDNTGKGTSEDVRKVLRESNKDGQRVIVDKIDLKEVVVTGFKTNVNTNVNTNHNINTTQRIIIRRSAELLNKPFSTNSAACAYDAKHERLYYTPMGINELRYIDLKSKETSIYYFENESFGALSSRHDVQNQITRMVIAGDGNGYALTNNGRHLIKFTTDKKAVITDLGELTDDPANGRYSVHSSSGYGGDMIADEKKSLYLITANRNVFKISLETKVASYVGSIKGLPREFSTNGAAVEKGTSVIVSSANSTLGYYRFDIESLQAEKVSAEGSVYNASDLANGNLISVKKKKAAKDPEPLVEEKPVAPVTASERERNDGIEVLQQNKVTVYPNPVAMGGVLRVSFKDQPQGIYTMQFMDIAGKLISSKQVNVSNRLQVEEYVLPELSARGNYLLKVVSEAKNVVSVNKVVVQ